MAITATYTVTLSASDKDHAKGEYVLASIVRTSPATLVPEGLYVQSATINMVSTSLLLKIISLEMERATAISSIRNILDVPP